MKSLKFLVVLFLINSFSYAFDGCYQSFINSYDILDSKSFVINDEELENDFDENPEAYVKEALVMVMSEVPNCEDVVSQIRVSQKDSGIVVKCQELLKGKSYSRSCIAESEIGYFFLNKDMLDNVNLFFSRWD
jgi:hypothetical protein